MKQKTKHEAKRGEVKLKRWLEAEAERTGCGPHAMRRRFDRGEYRRSVEVRWCNGRVAFVRQTGPLPDLPPDLRAERSGRRKKRGKREKVK